MNKRITKMTYLLAVFIIGVLAICIYSTYAIFTLESATGNVVNITTPNSLSIYNDIYQYNQFTIKENSAETIDVDIINSDKENKCYNIWWNIPISNVNENLITILEENKEKLTTEGQIEALSTKRTKLIIINDNDKPIKINVGVKINALKDNCSNINVNSRYKSIKEIYKNNITYLTENIINYKEHEDEESYTIYKDKKETKQYNKDELINVSTEFVYEDEIFTLTNIEKLTYQEIKDSNKEYFYCQNEPCQIIYKIKNVDINQEENKENIIINYDYYEGYSKGKSGVKKVDNDYYFYGDNPQNFIYFNCKNNNPNTCELYRIVGAFYNEETKEYNTKLIKNDYLEETSYGNTFEYEKSNIFKELNNLTIDNKYISDKEITYKIINNEKEVIKIEDINKTIISLNDYLNTSICRDKNIDEYKNECVKNNWLNRTLTENEWTNTAIIEKNEDDSTNEQDELTTVSSVYIIGNEIKKVRPEDSYRYRPVIYLKGRILIDSGDGSINNPYIIK